MSHRHNPSQPAFLDRERLESLKECIIGRGFRHFWFSISKRLGAPLCCLTGGTVSPDAEHRCARKNVGGVQPAPSSRRTPVLGFQRILQPQGSCMGTSACRPATGRNADCEYDKARCGNTGPSHFSQRGDNGSTTFPLARNSTSD